MTDLSAVQSLKAASRRSALLVLVGTIVALAALAVSANQAAREAKQANEFRQEAENEALRVQKLQLESQQLSASVAGLREALSASRMAISAFHEGDYATALQLYARKMNHLVEPE